MKIIQHGRQQASFSSIKRFKCDSCGCLFEADKGEYKVGNQYNELFYQCKCPECEKRANEISVRGSEIENTVIPVFQASFHGETWYKCPNCRKDFELYSAKGNRCPNCNQKFDFR